MTGAPGLHVTRWRSQGEPIVFVHGGFSWGLECWVEQQALASEYRLLLVDRCGHGASPDNGRHGFDEQADDILALTDGAVHLVGQSFGAVICLVAAVRSPQRLRSLTLIEPPAWSLLSDDPYVQAEEARTRAIFAAAPQVGPTAAYAQFIGASNTDAIDASLGEMDRRSIAATALKQPYPADAPISADALARLKVRALVVSAGRPADAAQERRDAGIAYRRVCDRLEDLLGAARAHFPFGAHNPQLFGEPFNSTLRLFLQATA